MIYSLIICAGRQSRFKTDLPKALVDIGGETLLSKNIRAMSPYCDNIYVVCSKENQHFFDYADKIVLDSGKGSGDAVWQALERLDIKDGDTCFVMWGDSLQQPAIFERLVNEYKGNTIIPTVYEENPYVQIIPNGNEGVEIKFSKFNEDITSGYHDLSVFYCNANELLYNLRKFRAKITDKQGKYLHKHGNEMEFLDVFNETDIKTSLLVLNSYKVFSFNTIEELNSLIKPE